MDVITGEAIGVRHQDLVKAGQRGPIPEAVQARALERRSAVAVIAEDAVYGQLPGLGGDEGLQAFQLLVNGLGAYLVRGRDPYVDRNTHELPPRRLRRVRHQQALPAGGPPSAAPCWTTGPGVGRLDPSGAGHPAVLGMRGNTAIGAAWLPPRRTDSSRRGRHPWASRALPALTTVRVQSLAGSGSRR